MKKDKEPSIIKLLAFVYKCYFHNTPFAPQVWLYLFLRFLTVLFPLVVSFLLGKLVDFSIEALSNNRGMEYMFPLILAFVIVTIIWVIVRNVYEYIDGNIDLWAPYLDDKVYLEKYIKIEPSAYENPKFINKKEMLNWNSHHVLHSLFQFLEATIVIPILIISFIAIFQFVPILSIFAIISSIPSALIIIKFGRKVWGIWGDKGEEKVKYSSYRGLLWDSNFEKLQEVYVFKYGKYLVDKAKEINKKFIERFRKIYTKRHIWGTIAGFASNAVNIFVLIYSLNLVLRGELTIGSLTFVIAAYRKFEDDVSDILMRLSNVYSNKKFLVIFYDVLNWKNEIVNGKQHLEDIKEGLSVEFKNVWFKYPDTSKWVLKDINFKVNKDGDIAIVGKNGAGKSTMIKLLLRVYDPQKGEIIVNGHNIKDLNLDEYYKLVGILSQSFNQLSITVEDNIFVGDVSKNMNKGVEIAAKNADIHDAIMQLPDKYKTFLSREVKDGIQLSGGQWQKLAIARAFFRNAKLLILDEPTSGVDSISEEKIFENIRNNAKDRTTIIVSHRFATVRKARRIIVIDDGKIVEDGDHPTLLSNNGLYAQMYNKQVG